MQTSNYQAVTYDFWNTLIAETTNSIDRRRALWTEIFFANNIEVRQQELDDAFAEGWNYFDTNWRNNVQSSLDGVVEAALTKLPIPKSSNIKQQLTDAYLEASELTPRKLLPDVKQTLERLKAMDIRLGVICDVGTIPSSRLRSWLEDLNVHEFFDYFGFSDDIGVYKPDPKIFNETLAGLEISDSSQCIHVGDLKRTDVAGARAINMTTVRYTGGRADPEDGEEADYVIDNHLEILKLFD
jgi:FMN phosphatase YigB (HAD superfamily)